MRLVTSGKTPYVRFDRNHYSIPHTHVRRPLTLLASPTFVRVLAGTEEIGRHVRSYDTNQIIEDPAHIAGLVAPTRQDNPSTARDRLRRAVPAAATLLERLAARGESLRYQAVRLLELLDDYGPQELAAAIDRALERDALRAPSPYSSKSARVSVPGRDPDGTARSPWGPRSRSHTASFGDLR